MTVREWCGQEGLSEKTYYYWQHKLYRMVSEEAQFVELPASQGTVGVENAVAAMEAGGVRIHQGGLVYTSLPFKFDVVRQNLQTRPYGRGRVSAIPVELNLGKISSKHSKEE